MSLGKKRTSINKKARLFFLILGLAELAVSIYGMFYSPFWWLGSVFGFLLLASLGALTIAAGWEAFIAATILIQLMVVPTAIVTYPTPFSFDDSKRIAEAWIQSSPDLLSQGLAKAIISTIGIPFDFGTDYLAGLIKPYLKDLFHWQYLLTVEGPVTWWLEDPRLSYGRVTIRVSPPLSGYMVRGGDGLEGASTLAELQSLEVIWLGSSRGEIIGRVLFANFTALKPLVTSGIGSFSYVDTSTFPPYAVRHVHYYLVTLNLPIIGKIVNAFIAIQVGGGASLINMITGNGNKVIVVVLQKLMIGETIVLAGNGIGWNNPGIVLYTSG